MHRGRLISSGQYWMRSALTDWCDSSHDTAVVNASIGCEHLMKAALYQRHPKRVLMNENDAQALLHLTGQGDAKKARTAGAEDAYKRLSKDMTLPLDKQERDRLFNGRNSIAHFGVHDYRETQEILALAVKLADALLSDLGLDANGFWGRFAQSRADLDRLRDDAAQADLHEMAETTRAVVSVKVRCAVKYAGLRDRTGEPVPELVVHGDPDGMPFGWNQECPVCRYPGAILVYDFDRLLEAQRAYTDPDAERFECPSCSLELDTSDELAVFGFATDYPGVFDGFDPAGA